MLMDVGQCQVLIVDVQEKLMPVIHRGDQVIENCCWLVNLAAELNVPCLMSEQYPAGLGQTVAKLRQLENHLTVFEKLYFSACRQSDGRSLLDAGNRKQCLIAGVEAHVCVLQTALDLQYSGHQVYVVAEAVSSRTPENRELGLARMIQAGITVVSKEMVVFEWLQRAATDDFRRLSKKFIDR